MKCDWCDKDLIQGTLDGGIVYRHTEEDNMNCPPKLIPKVLTDGPAEGIATERERCEGCMHFLPNHHPTCFRKSESVEPAAPVVQPKETHPCPDCGVECSCTLQENHCWHECNACDCGHELDDHEARADDYGARECSKCSCARYVAVADKPSSSLRYDGNEAVTHACGLLDVIKQEWGNSWSEHDQAVRDGLSRILSAQPAPVAVPEVELCLREDVDANHMCFNKKDHKGPCYEAPIVVRPEEDKVLRVYFGDVHNGKDARSIYLYACLYKCETGVLVISATMDYCLEAIKNRGWIVEKTGKSKLTAQPAPLPSDQKETSSAAQWDANLETKREKFIADLAAHLETERRMHAAWRKRADEAEAALPVGQKETK